MEQENRSLYDIDLKDFITLPQMYLDKLKTAAFGDLKRESWNSGDCVSNFCVYIHNKIMNELKEGRDVPTYVLNNVNLDIGTLADYCEEGGEEAYRAIKSAAKRSAGFYNRIVAYVRENKTDKKILAAVLSTQRDSRSFFNRKKILLELNEDE